jgi:hypothetical protein
METPVRKTDVPEMANVRTKQVFENLKHELVGEVLH